MKTILSFIIVIGTAVVLLPSCTKNELTAPQSSPSTASQGTKTYGHGALYQIELSANANGPQGGGVWLWVGLNSNGEGDYSGADCGHGVGATSDRGDVTWQYIGLNNDSIQINGVLLNGLNAFPTVITVPSAYGHYTGTLGSFLTLPSFIPPFIGHSQLQVAH